MGIRNGLAILTTILASGLAFSVGPAGAKPPPPHADPAFLEMFDDLEAFINDASLLDRGARNSLVKKVENAEAAFARGQVCTAANVLGAYLNETEAMRKGKGIPLAEDLRNRGRALRDALLLGAPPTLSCADPALGRQTEVTLGASDNQRLEATVRFGAPKLRTVKAGGEVWTQVRVAGVESEAGQPGRPAVPVWRTLVAVPREAGVSVTLRSEPRVRETLGMNLYPFQPQPVDQAEVGSGEDGGDAPLDLIPFANRPFAKDLRAYAGDAFRPRNPCSVALLGQVRDLAIAELSCASGQYNPATKTLRLFDALDMAVSFTKGSGAFVTERSLSPFEPAAGVSQGAVLNAAAVSKFVEAVDFKPLWLGEELLILTHPDFRAAADRLAAWKRSKGIATNVFNVHVKEGDGLYTSTEIEEFIHTRYEKCSVRPSYVLLMGDAEFIPTFYVPLGEAVIGSDYRYSQYPSSMFDFLPDFGFGRIPVDTLAQAQTVVDKIINYEKAPPTEPSFYQNASLAAQFQCCGMDPDGSPLADRAGTDQRTFIEVSEFVRNVMLGQGYSVERIYTKTVDEGGYCLEENPPGTCISTQTPYSGDQTPRRYPDGTPLPADLGPWSGFAWDGGTQDIVHAFNAGRFLIIHRDHGGTGGWSHPHFNSDDIAAIDNGDLLPVVFSVNCASGFFDNETANGDYSTTVGGVYFTERLLRKANGGAVGILGDTRNSPSTPNSVLTRGFIDAVWPSALPAFGDGASKRRLGDILNHGKLYMLSQLGVAGSGVDGLSAVNELLIWQVYGDPTLEMWTSRPTLLHADHAFTTLDAALKVSYGVEGATITALQMSAEELVPVGRGVVQGGVAVLPFVEKPVPGAPILLSASKENAVSVLLTESGALPDLVVGHLGLLKDSGTVVPGEDLTGKLEIEVWNQGGSAALGTVGPDGSVRQSGYMIDLVLSGDESVPLGFALLPLPPGEAFAEDGLLQGGRVSRTPDVAAGGSVFLSADPPISSDIGGVVPAWIPPGSYFLCARIDPGDAVAESDEGNNVRCIPVGVTAVGGPVGAGN